MDLAFVWLVLIAFIIIMYVVLDGFTLGVGLLFPWIRADIDRDKIVSTILPLWDGNETWLVFAGASLYGAFPGIFSALFPLLYLPLMLLIMGLLFRGVSLEFRLKAKASKRAWDACFFIGSLMAVVAQGLVLGCYVESFRVDPVTHQIFLSTWWTPFGVFCAGALVLGYSLLGSARLINKTSGELQERFFQLSSFSQWFLLAVLFFVAGYSLFIKAITLEAWYFHNESFLIYLIVVMFLFFLHAFSVYKRVAKIPFLSLILIFMVSYLALLGTQFYQVVLPNLSVFLSAKADDGALIFMLYGVAVLMPVLIFYTTYAYKIFGGQANEKIGY